jgi:hypothetical protein
MRVTLAARALRNWPYRRRWGSHWHMRCNYDWQKRKKRKHGSDARSLGRDRQQTPGTEKKAALPHEHTTENPALAGFFLALRLRPMLQHQRRLQRKLELHRLPMSLSYAMTFGAVTQRLQIPSGFVLGSTSYPQMSVWLAYTSWIPNVLAVLGYFAFTTRAVAQSPV